MACTWLPSIRISEWRKRAWDPDLASAVSDILTTEKLQDRLEAMMVELFNLQDLKGDGLLEEAELVKLNQKIAMLHYGKDVDTLAVQEHFREMFRDHLDPLGRPVDFTVFRRYMFNVLCEQDRDLNAQEMILEQFIAEATSGRELFHCPSFASATDGPFVPGRSFCQPVLGRDDRRSPLPASSSTLSRPPKLHLSHGVDTDPLSMSPSTCATTPGASSDSESDCDWPGTAQI